MSCPGPCADDERRPATATTAGASLVLQLCFYAISGLLRQHGLEVTGGGRRDRGCAGAVGRLASGGEAADQAAVHAGAGGGLGGGVPWPGPPPPGAPDPGGGGRGGGGTPPPGAGRPPWAGAPGGPSRPPPR